MKRFVSIFFLFIFSPELLRAEIKGVAFAGVPYPIGASGNYEIIFTAVMDAGGRFFYPTFQYEEIPAVLTQGNEKDFITACDMKAGPIAAMKKRNIKLLLPLHFIYPNGKDLPTRENDPLQALLACYGRDSIAAAVTYDEPVHSHVSLKDVAAVYARVKEVDDSLPVAMIHAPVTQDRLGEKNVRRTYLRNVKTYSRYADIVGFDVYPVPWIAGKILDPQTGVPTKNPDEAIASHIQWLKKYIQGKQLTVVLQGFSYKDHYAPENLPDFSREILDQVQIPTLEEMQSMVAAAQGEGIEFIIWWGQSLKRKNNKALWKNIREVSRQFSDAVN